MKADRYGRKCHIHDSSSQKGGGVYLSTFEEGKEAGLESCYVYNNRSTGDGKSSLGGGIYMKSNTFVKDCIIEDNVSPYTGGGIYCESTGVVYNSVIRNNRAEKNSSGGIYIELPIHLSADKIAPLVEASLTTSGVVQVGRHATDPGETAGCVENMLSYLNGQTDSLSSPIDKISVSDK